MSILEHHKPKTFEDFKSNLSQTRQIREFISNGKSMLIISGNLATGKSTLLDIVAHQYAETTEILHLSSHSNYVKDFTNFTTKKSIENIMFSKNKLVLVDDVNLMDKAFISLLKNNTVRVIVTCQSKEELKIQDLRKSVKLGADYLKLNRIAVSDCLILISDLVERLNLTHLYNCEVIMQKIKEHKCNLRRILQSLALYSHTGIDELADKAPHSNSNPMDMNIYELTSYFIKNKVDDRFISMNLTGIISFVVYENALTLLDLKKRDEKSLETYKTILRILVDHDQVQQFEHSSDSKAIADHLLNRRLNDTILEYSPKPFDKLKFTTVFNKLSVKSAFNKKLVNHVRSKNGYCNPYVDLIIGDDSSNELEALQKKFMADFSINAS